MYIVEFGAKLCSVVVSFEKFYAGTCQTCESKVAVPGEEITFSQTKSYYGNAEWCSTSPGFKCPACNGVDITISECEYGGYDYYSGCVVTERGQPPQFYVKEAFEKLVEDKGWLEGTHYTITP